MNEKCKLHLAYKATNVSKFHLNHSVLVLKHKPLMDDHPVVEEEILPLPLPLPPTPTHVLIFPIAAQGHVNSMLKLAELLCLAGFHVTFLLSDHIHDRLLRHTDVHKRFDHYPGFRFETIPDGIPAESSRSGSNFLTELIVSLTTVMKPLFRELLISSNRLISSETNRPVTCIITDGVMSFAIDVAEEIGIPIFYFRTISACSFWAYFRIPELIEAGELPFKGNDLDAPIQSIPGMETFLRQRDLPELCRVGDLSNHDFQFVSSETRQTTRPRGLILNTFEDLEGSILSHIRIHMPNIYTIGPLHAHHKTRLAARATSMMATSSNSLWEEDRSCMTWLDRQPLRSVIYVSFGSFAIITRPQLMEFWHGLVNSGKQFLWVIRPDLIVGENGEGQIPTELSEATKERGYMVGWAPQEEVLNHQAIGGFLTHSGWNSTLESIVAGVPMLCWPYFMDQQINSRFVGEVWKLGLDMKDTCDRVIIEKMVKDLMDVRRDEFMHSADQMANMARQSVREGGLSYSNLDRLIEDIRSMSLGAPSN